MMNKTFTLLLCGMLALGNALAQTHQLDSVVRTDASATYKFVPSYNETQQADGYTRYIRSGNTWENDTKIAFQRNENNIDTAITTAIWSDDAWTETEKEAFEYNAQNQLVRHTIRQKSNGVWLDSIKTDYGYNEGYLKTITIAKAQNGVLQNKTKAEYTYNKNAITILNYTWNGNWKVANKLDNTYANDILVQSIYQLVNNGGFQPSYKFEYTYTNTTKTEKRYNYDAESTPEWTLVAERNYVFNDAGQETGYCYTVFGNKRDSTTHNYTAHGDLENYTKYDASNSWAEALDEAYKHHNILTENCIGAAFAQQHITVAGKHTYAIAAFTRTENGTQTRRDTYCIHALYPTALPTTEAPAEIVAHDGRIFGDQSMRIYTPSGLDVTAQNGALRGIYIVKIGTKATKIVVR